MAERATAKKQFSPQKTFLALESVSKYASK